MELEELCLQKGKADEGLIGLYDFEGEDSSSIEAELAKEISIRQDELRRLEKAHEVYAGFAKDGIETPKERGKAILEVAKRRNDGKLLEEAASHGLSEARIELAKALYLGKYGLAKNPHDALSILIEEADRDNAKAAYEIVKFQAKYPDLIGSDAAYKYCKKAAKLGLAVAKKRLEKPFEESNQTKALKERLAKGEEGINYLLYLRQDLPLKQRQQYLLAALEEGDGRANYDIGKGLLDAKEYELAIPYLEKSVEKGVGEACFALADAKLKGAPHYYKSGGLPMVLTKAHKEELALMEKAAELGNIRGLCIMGRTYARGLLVKKDTKKAMAYLKKAYDQGERVDSPRLIGEIYRYDMADGTAKKAVEFYKIAADHGNVSAMLGLMDIYSLGLREIKPNPKKAAYYRYLSGVDDF